MLNRHAVMSSALALVAALATTGATTVRALPQPPSTPAAVPAPPSPPPPPTPPTPPAPPAPPAPPPPLHGPLDITVMRGGPGGERTQLFLPGGEPEFDFLTMPLAMGGAPVTGAPYSAEAVTEIVQTLADGNRIVRQSSTPLYRDSRGRTRREQGLARIGHLVGNAMGANPGRASGRTTGLEEGRVTVQIHDPAAGALFILDPQKKEARRLPAPRVSVNRQVRRLADGTASRPADRVEVRRGGDDLTEVRILRHRAGDPAEVTSDTKTEQLGTRSFEGVQAEGTRTTVTIPAGQIGNEQPIHVVSERWYSPELQMLVFSRQSDPRFGETTYRLANLVRADPAPELFQVPADYRVVDHVKELDLHLKDLDGRLQQLDGQLKALDGLGDRLRRQLREPRPSLPGDRR